MDEIKGMPQRLSRREWLKVMGVGSAAALLSACVPKTIEVIKEVPVEVTREVEVPIEVEVPVEVPVERTVVVEVPAGFTAQEGELRVLVCSYQDYEVDILEEFNAVFEETHPGVTVSQELLPAGQNRFERLVTQIAAGTLADVFDVWEGYVQPSAASGWMVNLDPYFEADPLVSKDDLVEAALVGGSYDGNVYAFDFSFMPGPIALYYNVDHFDAAGLRYPTADWTWDDMREAAFALTIDADADGVPEQWGLSYDLSFVAWLYWIWSNGGDVLNEDETECAMDAPETAAALQYWADLALVDNVAIPSDQLASLQDGLNAFMTGLIGMHLGNFWDIADLAAAREEGFNWQGVLSPKAPYGGRTWYEYFRGWSVYSGTRIPDTAWLYIRDFMPWCTPRFIDAGTLGLPGLKPLLYLFSNDETRALGWDELISLAAKPDALKIPAAGGKFDKLSQIIQSELDLVFIGEKMAAEAAADVCPTVNETLAAA